MASLGTSHTMPMLTSVQEAVGSLTRLNSEKLVTTRVLISGGMEENKWGFAGQTWE